MWGSDSQTMRGAIYKSFQRTCGFSRKRYAFLDGFGLCGVGINCADKIFQFNWNLKFRRQIFQKIFFYCYLYLPLQVLSQNVYGQIINDVIIINLKIYSNERRFHIPWNCLTYKIR